MKRVAEEILWLIQDLGELTWRIAITPYGKLRLHDIPRSTYDRHLRNLARDNYIKVQNIESVRRWSLSRKGLNYLKSFKLRQDGLSTIIMFDIPQNLSVYRTKLRRFLKNHNYKQLQKSVFISEYALSNEIRDRINELNLRQYIKVIAGKIER
jgi:CRISPR/Cas system-associated endoribonuclease Cas2